MNASPPHPLRASLRKALKNALARAERKAEKQRGELAEADRAENDRQAGELLKGQAANVPPRAATVDLDDYFHPGRTRTIELDPRLSALDNARRYFKRAKKMERGRAALDAEYAKTGVERDALAALAADFAAWEADAAPDAPPPPELGARAEALRVHVPGVAGAAPSAPASQREARRPLGPRLEDVARRFVSHDGLDIWVGQSAADNDALSLKCARGRDWWLHVAHQTGSHVVVRGLERLQHKGERTETFLPQETLLDAAHLAVHYSKARNATRAEVDYTRACHVRKPRGAKPGLVSLAQHRTLSLRLEPARLARLLKGG